MIAEGSARSYNYYAILIPDSILCVGFTASWITVVAAGFNGKSEMEIVLLVFCVFGRFVLIQA
jgi:hypothetical protein